eukprot:5776910-Pleurochrysis_carterae.AAC.3
MLVILNWPCGLSGCVAMYAMRFCRCPRRVRHDDHSLNVSPGHLNRTRYRGSNKMRENVCPTGCTPGMDHGKSREFLGTLNKHRSASESVRRRSSDLHMSRVRPSTSCNQSSVHPSSISKGMTSCDVISFEAFSSDVVSARPCSAFGTHSVMLQLRSINRLVFVQVFLFNFGALTDMHSGRKLREQL